MALRLPELIIIFVVALLIFGPKKLPEMGAQIGRTLNAFRKSMSEFNRNPLDDFDLEAFTAQQREIRALEARRLELEILERELSVKRAEAALRATQDADLPVYRLETTIEEEDYVAPGKVVDADSGSGEMARTAEKPVETVEPAKTVGSVKTVESSKTVDPIKATEPVSEAKVTPTVSAQAE